MAYDEGLADRIREVLAAVPAVTEKRMFGGLAFLVADRLTVAASGRGGLMLRVDPDEEDALLAEPGVEPVVMRGRPVVGWLHVPRAALEVDEELERWVRIAVERTRSLPSP